jgi:hypothetical protein
MNIVPDSIKSKTTIIAERDTLITKLAEQQSKYQSELSEENHKCEIFGSVYARMRHQFDEQKYFMNELTTENKRLTTENKSLHKKIDNLYQLYVPPPEFNPNAISAHGSGKQGTEYFVALSAA